MLLDSQTQLDLPEMDKDNQNSASSKSREKDAKICRQIGTLTGTLAHLQLVPAATSEN
jgi:hypothetical protein